LSETRIARAVAAGLETVEIGITGGRRVAGALALPAQTPALAVMLVHEWWGLNDQIKAVAAELAKAGYVALTVDLCGGKVATTPEEAKALIGGLDGATAAETLDAWNAWLRDHTMTTDKLGTIGWCFGGGWSLNAGQVAPVEATVVYYGRVGPEFGGVSRSVEALGALRGPVLGHYATRDGWINQEMVTGFEERMAAVGKPYTSHWYEAYQAFANPMTQRYDAEDAALAWTRTLNFLENRLSG
jgi:carboxymethylenebutenolidase